LTSVVWKRSVGVIGLYVLIGIVFVLKNRRLKISRAALPVSPEPSHRAQVPIILQNCQL
jgi:hypothetical protein